MPTLSIIVPVYNTEKYLYRCINSILSQTYIDFECILVENGSSDNSPKICDEFKEKDKRIIVIHQEARGVSHARNIGIDIAKGSYICFVDSDDWLSLNYCALLKENIENYDLVICGIYQTVDGISKAIKIVNKDVIYNRKSFFSNFSKIRKSKYSDIILLHSLWNKIYRRDIINHNNGIRFKEEISLGEDYIFNLEYITRCNGIRLIPELLYYYRFVNDSLSHQIKVQSVYDQLEVIHYMKIYIQAEPLIKNKVNLVHIYSVYYYCVVKCFYLFNTIDNTIDKPILYELIEKIRNDLSVYKILLYYCSIKRLIILLLTKCKMFCVLRQIFNFHSFITNLVR
jgi:glycosyltransferase involved in cell wall biosynthesis